MEVFTKLLFFTSFVLGFVWSDGVLPVEKCKLEDSSCMRAAFQAAVPQFMSGVPEIGIEVLDPLNMDDLAFDLSGLQFTLKGGKMKGLKTTVIDKVHWEMGKKRINVEYHLNGTVKGHYTAAGQLLILPISGDGEMKVKLRNLQIKMHIDFKLEKGEDGKDYVKPINLEFVFEVKDNAHFTLTNLFNGNKPLSDTMHTFVNENWQQVSQEFGRPLVEVSAKKLYANVQVFFSKQALADIAVL